VSAIARPGVGVPGVNRRVSVPWRRLLVVGACAVLVGLLAERTAFEWRDPLGWLPDLLVGWTFVACGLVAGSRRSEHSTGLLLTAVGFAWFAGNFAALDWAPAAWLAAQAAFVHRGLVIHAIVAAPAGRLASRTALVLVGAGYVACLAPLARSDGVTAVVGAAVLAGGLAPLVRGRGRVSPALRPAIAAAVVFGGSLAVAAAVRLALPAGAGDHAMLVTYEAALCVVAIVLTAGIAERAGERAEVENLVVELGESGPGSLRDGLSRALGDPTLEIGYRLPDQDQFVDAGGRELRLPHHGPGRTVTMVERAGRPVAAIVHDPAVLDDPTLTAAVSSATRLAAANAQLQAEARERLTELRASRRRLVEAGDDERRRLEHRLHEGVEQQLTALAGALERTRSAARAGPPAQDVIDHIDDAQLQLALSLRELGELARGLHPLPLAEHGLSGALRRLASSSAVDVEIAVDARRLAPGVEVAAYFVCAEGLANMTKYAAASHARIDVRRADGSIRVTVADDGVGGARAAEGGGLRGLADRVQAHGGTLRIDSPPGRGTRLVAEIPLAAEDAR
jgi:signal transduction histidine kinase